MVGSGTVADPGPSSLMLRHHRRWLNRRGLLQRPWFVLGSAPAPTIPSRLPADTAYVYVKYAGHSAKKLGLPDADLTFLLKKTLPAQVEGLALGHILRMQQRLTASQAAKRWLWLSSAAECEITHAERDEMVVRAAGSLFGDVGQEARPSNGVALVCYALALGVPQVIVAGLSLEMDGYEYDRAARTRRHVPEDRAALSALARLHPQLMTSEKRLSELTGLPSYTG